MSITQEKLEQKIFNLVYQWGRVGIVADHTAPTYVAYIQELIDSAKREGAITELGKLMSSGLMQRAWIPELDKYYDDRIAQLEQSEESI